MAQDTRPFDPTLNGSPAKSALGMLDGALIHLVDYGKIELGTGHSASLRSVRQFLRDLVDAEIADEEKKAKKK